MIFLVVEETSKVGSCFLPLEVLGKSYNREIEWRREKEREREGAGGRGRGRERDGEEREATKGEIK